MTLSAELQSILARYDLLTHTFYQYWNEGKLANSTLVEYAKQYYHHVAAFPRCLSAIHTQCDSASGRKILLENLVEEEFNSPTHPELWLDFAASLGIDAKHVQATEMNKETSKLLEVFKTASNSSYEEGIGALYAHEWQYSKIAETKKTGLTKFYGIEDKQALEFFTVHAEVDVWHAQQLTELLDQIPNDKHEAVKKAAIKAGQALWGFLDGMLMQHKTCGAA